MAEIMASVKNRINDLYDKRKKTQLAQLRDSQEKAVGKIKQQKGQTDREYYDKRNQTDVVNMQNRRALAERMASLGQTGRNVSGQIALQAARQNTLGDLNEQEQGIMNAYNQQIQQINDPSRSETIISSIESERSAAMANALERAIERQRQQEEFQKRLEMQQEQFQKQLEWEREKFNRLHSGGSGGGGGGSRSGGSGGAYLSDADLLDIMYKNSPRVVDSGDADRVLNEESVNRGQMNDYAAMEKAYRNRKRNSSRSTAGRLGGPRMIM